MKRGLLVAALLVAGVLGAGCYPSPTRRYPDATSIDGLAVDPANQDVVTALHAGRIERSADGGLTWNVEPAFAELEAIAASGSTIYGLATNHVAGAHPTTSVWRSDDLGDTFVLAGSFTAGPSGLPYRIAALDSRSVVVSVNAQTPFIVHTSDGGATWTAATVSSASVGNSFSPLVVAGDRADAQVVYVGGSSWLLRSTDGGSAFSGMNPPVVGEPVADIAASGSSLFAATPRGLGVSTDRGGTWAIRPVGSGGAVLTVALDESTTPRRVYATLDRGGLYASTDDGLTFTLILPTGRGPIIARGPVLYLHGTRTADSGTTFRPFSPFDYVAWVTVY